MAKAKRKNPEIYGPHQPDLFKDYDTRQRQYVDPKDLTDAQMMELPFESILAEEWPDLDLKVSLAIIKNSGTKRKDVPEDVWDELSEEEQDAIKANDPDREARIEALVEKFVERYKWAVEPSDEYVIDQANDSNDLDMFLREDADHLVERVENYGSRSDQRELADLVEELMGNGHSEESAKRAIDEAMQNSGNYTSSIGSEYDRAFYKTSVSTGWVSIDYGDYENIIKNMSEDEVEEAVEEINRQTDKVYQIRIRPTNTRPMRYERDLEASDIMDKNFSIEKDFEAYSYVDFEPDWDKIKNAALGLEVPELEEGSEEALERKWAEHDERIAMKWPDGFFVLDLIPSELAPEGKEMGFCIGQRQYGYVQAVERGKAKAFSLRTPSGRPKLTLFAEINDDEGGGEVTEISQVKGKGNRLPGYNLGAAGGKLAHPNEVDKIVEFIVVTLHFNPFMVSDLQPAMREIGYLAHENVPWARNLANLIASANMQEPGDGWVISRALRAAPRENPSRHTCGAHGGACTGFCMPYRPRR